MALKDTYINYIELSNGDKYPIGGHHKTGSWSGLTYTAGVVGSNTSVLSFTIPTGTTATTVAAGNHTHTNYVPYDGVLMPTNPFGGKKVYINHTDNAFASADKKFYITITRHLKESGGVTYPYVDTSKTMADDDYYVDGPVDANLTSSAATLFDGSYENGISAQNTGKTYLKIRIMFGSNTSPSASSSYFPGYPYGYWYLSFYYNNTPNLVSQARVYNKYAAHTVGWHLYNATWYSGSASSANVIHLITDTNDYQRTCVEFIIYGNTSSGRAVQLTEIDYRLQRPNLSRDGSTVTKYGAQSLYYNFTWYTNHAETAQIGADGTIEATKFKKYNNALAPASGQYLAVYDANGFQRLTTAYTTFTDTTADQEFLGSDFKWHKVKHPTVDIPDITIATATGSGNAITSLTASEHTITPVLGKSFSEVGHNHDGIYVKPNDLGTAAYKDVGTASGQLPVLNSNGKLPSSVLPEIEITDTYVVASEAEMLALSNAGKGDIAVRTDLNKTFILKQTPASTLANWQELLTPTDAVQSVNGKTGAVVLNHSDVGAAASNHNHDTRYWVSNFSDTASVVADNTDLNTVVTPGSYKVSSAASAATMTNGPEKATGYAFQVVKGGGGQAIYQIAYVNVPQYNGDAGLVWIRARDGNNANLWHPWVKYAFSSGAFADNAIPMYDTDKLAFVSSGILKDNIAQKSDIKNSTITIKQTGQSDQTFTLNGAAKTISLADTNTTYSPVFGTAVTSVTANQTGNALTGIEFGSTSVLKSVTLNNGSINGTTKYLQIGTATAAIGAAANGTTTALTSVSISSTASAASPTHTHSITTDGNVTLASGTTGDVEVAYSINGTSYTPAGSITLATSNFTTTDVITGISGGAGSFTVNAPTSSGTGRSARSNLTFSHTHTAASASGTAAQAFTGISTTKPTWSGTAATIKPTLNTTKITATFTGTAVTSGAPSGTAVSGLVTGIGTNGTTVLTGVKTTGTITYVNSVTSGTNTSGIKYLEAASLNNPTLTPTATDVYNSVSNTNTDSFLKNVSVGTGSVVTNIQED